MFMAPQPLSRRPLHNELCSGQQQWQGDVTQRLGQKKRKKKSEIKNSPEKIEKKKLFQKEGKKTDELKGNPSCASVGGTRRVVTAAGGGVRRGLILQNGHTCLTHAHWRGTADPKKTSGGGVAGWGWGVWLKHMLHHNL